MAVVLMLLMVVRSCFELLGIASVAPFLSVIASENFGIEEYPRLFVVYEYFEFTSIRNFQIFLGVVSLIALLISAGFRTLTDYAINV